MQNKNNIIFKSKDFAIYIPYPNEIIGFYQSEFNSNLITIQDFYKECISGNHNYVKYLFEASNEFNNSWWDYVLEFKNQTLSKKLIDNIIIDLKLTFNKYNYLHETNELNYNLVNLNEIKLFFKKIDFCNQVLAAGKYLPNPSIDEALSLLSNNIILNLMNNHLSFLNIHFEKSNLQNSLQIDVLNHIVTHITFTFWDYQNIITV